MENYTKNIKNILWDNDISRLKNDDNIVIERLLSFGDIEDIQEAEKRIWKKKIKAYLKLNSYKLDKKSVNFWEKIYWIKVLNNEYSVYEQLNSPVFWRNIG